MDQRPTPIEAPKSRLRTRIGVLRDRPRRRRRTSASLLLTPLIDVLVVMTIYLLSNFDASGEICCHPPIELPMAKRGGELMRAPVVAISRASALPNSSVVTLDGSEMATLQELPSGLDWKMAKLSERLEIHKNNWKLTHPGRRFKGTLIIQADHRTAFSVLKRVFYSAAIAGYADLHLAVWKQPQSTE